MAVLGHLAHANAAGGGGGGEELRGRHARCVRRPLRARRRGARRVPFRPRPQGHAPAASDASDPWQKALLPLFRASPCLPALQLPQQGMDGGRPKLSPSDTAKKTIIAPRKLGFKWSCRSRRARPHNYLAQSQPTKVRRHRSSSSDQSHPCTHTHTETCWYETRGDLISLPPPPPSVYAEQTWRVCPPSSRCWHSASRSSPPRCVAAVFQRGAHAAAPPRRRATAARATPGQAATCK